MAEEGVGSLLATFVDVLKPATTALRDGLALGSLLRTVDPELDLPDPTLGGALGPGGGLTAVAEVLDERISSAVSHISDLDADSPVVRAAAFAGLVEATGAIVDGIRAAGGAFADLDLAALGFTGVRATPGHWATLFAELPTQLLISWLDAEAPVAGGVMRAIGAFTVDPAGVERIDLAALGTALTDPSTHWRELSGWSTGQLDGDAVHRFLGDLAASVGIGERIGSPSDEVRELLGTDQPDATTVVELPLVSGFLPGGAGMVEAGLVAGVVASRGSTPDAVLVTNLAYGAVNAEIPLGETWRWRFDGDADATAMFGVMFQPGGTTTLRRGSGTWASASLVGAPPTPWRLLGTAHESRVELSNLALGVGIVADATAPELWGSADLSSLALTLVPSNGFIAAIIGGTGRTIPLSVDLRWSSRTGLTLGGSAGLSVTMPLEVTIGPVSVRSVTLALSASSDGQIELAISTMLSASLGVIEMSVSGFGVVARIGDAPDGDGTLGPIDVTVAAEAPDGVGIDVDIGVVAGGGYLSIDHDAGSYEGVIDLEVMSVGISAVVIIDTKLPDVDGWSMFFALFLDLPSIQLGFGFALTGVGGVAGINRAVDVDALGSAVRSGALDSILFPAEPIAEAPIVIEEFRAIFPPADGSYVFGPIVRIAWGTPPLIEARLGIVIQLPDPVVIVVLGSIAAVLPEPEVALVELHMDVAGVIDVANGTLAIDASLHDSQVAGFASVRRHGASGRLHRRRAVPALGRRVPPEVRGTGRLPRPAARDVRDPRRVGAAHRLHVVLRDHVELGAVWR